MRALSTVASIGRHSIYAAAEALIIIAVAITLVLALALATRGGSPLGADPVMGAKGGAKGVITVPDGTFSGTTTATVNPGGSGAMALARCYQNDTLVYAQYVQVDSTNHAIFKLGPTQMWTSGGARCTAEEGAFGNGGRWRTFATTTFSVSG